MFSPAPRSVLGCHIYKGRIFSWMQRRNSLVEVDPFLGELSRAVLRVFVRLVLDHLHALPTLTLLVAVLADHVELTDPVLQGQEEKRKSIIPRVTVDGLSPSTAVMKVLWP